jgi:GNAT superfamily N-acetyltransferase
VEVKVILDRIKVTQCSSAGGITVSSVVYVEGVALPRSGNFYVLPEHRRKGLARRLVEHAKALVPYPGLFGGLRHHHASRRAAASAQSINTPGSASISGRMSVSATLDD